MARIMPLADGSKKKKHRPPFPRDRHEPRAGSEETEDAIVKAADCGMA